MKTFFTLLFATLFSSFAFAYGEGKITITVPVQKNVQIYVDGRLYQGNDNTIVLNNVQSGNHSIKIYKARKNKARNNRSAASNVLIYSSNIYVRPSYHVDVVINRFGKALVDEKALNDRNNPWNEFEYDDGDNGDNGDNYYSNGVINDQEFNQMLQRIRGQVFGKLANAKDGIKRNYFRTMQVRELMQIFTLESDKLEIAKLAYRKTVDRQNYRQLYNLLGYRSQTQLDTYIKEQRF